MGPRPFPRRIPRVNSAIRVRDLGSGPDRFPRARVMMGRRTSVAAIAIAVALGPVLPAAAQFGWIFGDPPRPPSNVPGGRPQQPYPQQPDYPPPPANYPPAGYPPP